MLLNHFPCEAALQLTNTRAEMFSYNEDQLQNYTDYFTDWDTPPQQIEGQKQIQYEPEKSTTHPYSLQGEPLDNRREKNRERERKRQQRLKEAFEVLRTVIPDYFSGIEPGERLTTIKTLRLAKKYIASLHQLLGNS